MGSSGQVVLVAGGAGFLGSHICRALLDRGDEVICVDNLATSTGANITDLTGRAGFAFVHHDITTPFCGSAAFTEALASRRLTRICNHASPASPPTYQRLAVETLLVGSVGMKNLLDLAVEHGARLLQASTSEVYGDPHVHPQPESYWGNVNPNGPRSMYDESKRFAEAMCAAYVNSHNVDLRTVRIFNTYGPAMTPDDGRVVTAFVGQALLGQPLTIFGDGSQTRSFCFVSDQVDGQLRLLDSDVRGPVNIGNPTEFTMLELADVVLEVTGGRSKLAYEPLPGDDPTQRRPDITRATTLLGWEPKVQLREGLERTVAWFRTQPGFA
jgi:nucleoside-diphosphate-sugar epimerase